MHSVLATVFGSLTVATATIPHSVLAAAVPEGMVIPDWAQYGVAGVLGFLCALMLWLGYKERTATTAASVKIAEVNAAALEKVAASMTKISSDFAETNTHLRNMKCIREQM